MARVTAQRWSNLVTNGAVSKQENDQYQAQFQGADRQRSGIAAGHCGGQSNIVSAQANLARLEELQGFKLVKAPFDGVIHRAQYRRGRAH